MVLREVDEKADGSFCFWLLGECSISKGQSCVLGNPTLVAKERMWTLTSHYIQKLAPNGCKDLSVRTETIKLSEENLEKNLHDIGFDNDSMDMTPKAQAVGEKKNR